jgi:hypothetical protein
MKMEQVVTVINSRKVTMLVEATEVGMLLHVTIVVNKDIRWKNVLRIKMMEEGMK